MSEFKFNSDNLIIAESIFRKYPENKKRSALIPLLDLAQRQSGGWLPKGAMDYVATLVDLPVIEVYSVASFYSMFNLKPIGKNLIQVCGTTPCWLKGAADLMSACKSHLSIKEGEVSEDGKFTLMEVECLGACVDAPVVQINDDYYENLTPESLLGILEKLK